MSSFPSDTALSTAADGGFIRGRSPAIQCLNSILEEIARTNISVLLIGESGTGKGVYGRMIHRLSRGGHAPLRKVSCRAVAREKLPELRSDLEGEGSAVEPGTLFLDDIDELDREGQKILVSLFTDADIDEHKSNRPRVIASSSRNLEKEIESGTFRKELYFRINGVCLRLPPLRDRKEDIQPFLGYFLAKHAAELGREAPTLTDTELGVLMAHGWPGNIRELENLARRIVLLGDFQRAIEELSEMPKLESAQRDEPRGFSLKAAARTASRRAEHDLISKALEQTHWNRKRAAQQLQISYKSLLYKIKQTGLEEEQKSGGE
jgi:two-component system, NtrC family, response regulator AtoC